MESPYPGKRSYPEGIVIFVDPTISVENGSRVISRRLDSTEATFKEYYEDDGKKYLKPINPQYPTSEMDEDSIIIGVVIGSFVAE
jgi:SOS-response transcriptional repressor LexA